MPDVAAEIGRWMLLASALIVVVCAGTVVPRLLSVRRRARLLQVHAVAARAEVESMVAEVGESRAEMERLLRPWRVALKWTTHPLTRALLHSYHRRWTEWRTR